MLIFHLFTLLIFLWGPYLFSSVEEERFSRYIQGHLIIQDYTSAIEEAKEALVHYPQSAALHEGYIQALAHSGNEKGLLVAWEAYIEAFPEKKMNRGLIEEMGWGILKKASLSSSLIMRQMALLAAFFSQDAKGVAILHQGLKDPNYAIRAVAVKLASHFRDRKLSEEVKRLFKEEKVWAVRENVLDAIGKMKILSLRPDLEALIASDESLASEMALSIKSLLQLLDAINRPEIERLSLSSRSGLRELAAQAIAHFQSSRDIDLLFILAKDPHPDVRFKAIQAIGQLRPSKQQEAVLSIARNNVKGNNYHVSLSAAWLLTLYEPEEGQSAFTRLLNDRRGEVRSLSAAAIGASGKYGITLALDQFRTHPDPYVRLNLALGLIGQRQATEEAAQYLDQMLRGDKEKWSTLEAGLFRAVMHVPGRKSDDPLISPEMDNQLKRLELLNLLAIVKDPNAQEAIRLYLSERSIEISATAAVLLLTEGDESAIDIVQQLLKDSHPKIRLSAALILSLWSREESAIQILEEGYQTADWELKTKILEGIGRIGSTRSVPFLIQVLKEPSQTMRLIAAMALIQCMNH